MMNFRHGTNRADSSLNTAISCCSAYTEIARQHETTPNSITVDQQREWRRWIIETFIHATYGVVPVDRLVDEILDREPDSIERSTIKTGVTKTVLPQLDSENVLSYDVERELVINYGN